MDRDLIPPYIIISQEWKVIICSAQSCGYIIRPTRLHTHLTSTHHHIDQQASRLICTALRQQLDTQYNISDIILPAIVIPPIHGLKVHSDGLKCIVSPSTCHYIGRTVETMRKHIHRAHQQKEKQLPGRPSRSKVQQQKGLPISFKNIECQRFTTSGPNSTFFEVDTTMTIHEDSTTTRLPIHTDDIGSRLNTAWEHFGKQTSVVLQSSQSHNLANIRDKEADEPNPWLERTQWLQQLNSHNPSELLASIQEPDPTEEPIETAIWDSVKLLLIKCETSVKNRVGNFIKLEAIRVEKHQTRYYPLQPYQTKAALIESIRSWQHILMFFFRGRRMETRRKQPKYKLNPHQKHCQESLYLQAKSYIHAERDVSRSSDSSSSASSSSSRRSAVSKLALQRACLNFCISLLRQQSKKHEYDCALISAIAILGVLPHGFKTAHQYTPILSGIIKTSRYLVIQLALEEAGIQSSSDTDSTHSDSGSAASGHGASTHAEPSKRPYSGCLELVKSYVDGFMIRGSQSPVQWMLDLRAYGMKIQYTTTSPGAIGWHGDQLLYKDIQFTMPQFKGFIHSLVKQAKDQLIEDILLLSPNQQPPQIPWASLRDDPANATDGWNFLQDTRVAWPIDGECWLYDQIKASHKLKKRFIKTGQASNKTDGINPRAFTLYAKGVKLFMERLLVLLHITGGQPARGPELMSIQYYNIREGSYRNIHIENRRVVFSTYYHKGYTRSGSVKEIQRYLPDEVGELVIWFIWLVKPFQARYEYLINGETTTSSYLWAGGLDNEKWNPIRLRQSLIRESKSILGQPFGIAAYRHIAIAIGRRYCQDGVDFNYDDDDEDGDWNEDNDSDEYRPDQAGNTTYINNMIYARTIEEGPGTTFESRKKYLKTSLAWHKVLGFTTARNTQAGHASHSSLPIMPKPHDRLMRTWQTLRSINPEQQLKIMYGDGATFRAGQKDAIQAVMSGRSNIACVLPTGGGKSLIFMLPAACTPRSVTILVVPLVSLKADLQRRCQDMSIYAREWDSHAQPDDASIVLVTPEAAVTDAFFSFINRLIVASRLDRIIVDECHVILSIKSTFRHHMTRIGELCAKAETQTVLLTATLPPSMEQGLWDFMYWRKPNVTMVRVPTRRPNIAYSVVSFGGTVPAAELGTAAELIRDLLTTRYPTGRAIIYCTSIRRAQQAAVLLQCGAYYASAEDKDKVLEAFLYGPSRIIVATGALGVGIDVRNVQLVVHIDMPFSLLDYAQESGRAGRQGQPSEAIIIARVESHGAAYRKSALETDTPLREYIQASRSPRVCRRLILDEHLDGITNGSICQPNESACDVCCGARPYIQYLLTDTAEGKPQEMNKREHAISSHTTTIDMLSFQQHTEQRRAASRALASSTRSCEADIKHIMDTMDKLDSSCLICMSFGTEAAHDLSKCPEPAGVEAKEWALKLRSKLKFEPYAACYGCCLPQKLCPRWEETCKNTFITRQGVSCQYSRYLLCNVLAVHVFIGEYNSYDTWIQRLIGKHTKDDECEMLASHLQKRKDKSGIQGSNLFWECIKNLPHSTHSEL